MTDKCTPPPIIRFYRLIWNIWKERRFARFVDTLQPQKSDTLLDLGGYPFNWFRRGEHFSRVDTVNLGRPAPFEAPPGAPAIRSLSGDARKLDLADNSYDIVFSNSVIEHVGDLAEQRDFAREARRIGSSLWIQTPARECPIEPHFLGLFIHWLPNRWHARLARWLSIRGLSGAAGPLELEAIAQTTRLLSKAEMEALFPDCEIWTERMFFLIPKSHVAIRQRNKPTARNCSLTC